MKTIIKFIKTTVVGGLVIVVPMAIIVLVLADVFKKLILVTDPLTKNMTLGPLTNAIIAILFVVLVIVFMFFIAGLLLNSFWGKGIRKWLENTVFERIPMYSTLKQITQRVTGIENSNFPVAEVDVYGTGVKVLGVVIEKLEDGRLMVYSPYSPVVTVGQLYVVPEERVKVLDSSIPDALNCLSKMGLESNKVFRSSH